MSKRAPHRPWTTALVTGASSGIGEAIAERLTRDGVDVVAVARRGERLAGLAERCADHAGGVEVLAADLASGDGRLRVAARLADTDRPVDLLVNNAGVGVSGPFLDADPDRYLAMIELNVSALVALSHVAAEQMRARRRGWILDVASVGGLAPGPGFAVYSATKAFVVSFGESLHEELRGSGVTVTVVCPGATRTEFGAAAGSDGAGIPAFMWQSPAEVAAEALAATATGKAVHITGAVNRLPTALTSVLPRSWRRRIAALVAARI